MNGRGKKCKCSLYFLTVAMVAKKLLVDDQILSELIVPLCFYMCNLSFK